MIDLSPRRFGRTGTSVSPVWRTIATAQSGDAVVIPNHVELAATPLVDPSFVAIEIGPDELERKADQLLIDRLAKLSRTSCDLLIVKDIASADVKVGWPMHRLQQLRDRGLCKWFAIETHTPLEAEWIAANSSVHAIIAPWTPEDMSLRYRVFEAAQNADVAIVTRAATRDELAFQLSTPQITAAITDQDARELKLLEGDAIEDYWAAYTATHEEPAKLKSGHPPEDA
jgi:hypothetical protein